jgi:hypothetical protein
MAERRVRKVDWLKVVDTARHNPDKWIKVGPLDGAIATRLRTGRYRYIDPGSIEVKTVRVTPNKRPSWLYIRWKETGGGSRVDSPEEGSDAGQASQEPGASVPD